MEFFLCPGIHLLGQIPSILQCERFRRTISSFNLSNGRRTDRLSDEIYRTLFYYLFFFFFFVVEIFRRCLKTGNSTILNGQVIYDLCNWEIVKQSYSFLKISFEKINQRIIRRSIKKDYMTMKHIKTRYKVSFLKGAFYRFWWNKIP